ncbi:MAG: GGDEF domain-containing protein [Lachnospiraceae bacterium]|nr:GGDEF domain-containing protein [Lachnospiraceae bacterium]
MTEEKKTQFYALFEEMVDIMATVERLERPKFIDCLERICQLFHISKGVTEFYQTPQHERNHDGEIMIDHDDGHGEVEILHRRIVTPTSAILIGTLYAAKDAPALDDEELMRLDLMLRAMMAFITRNRLLRVVEQLGFYDEYGYTNLRYFTRYLGNLQEKKKLTSMTVGCINLRHFGLINQEIGRPLGDKVMRGFFEMMEMAVGENGMVCRLGGDNFTIAFEKRLVDQVLAVTAGTPVAYDDAHEKRVTVYVSVGLYSIPEDFVFDGPGVLLDRIMTALNLARQGTSGHVVFYDDSVRASKQSLQRLQGEFPMAMKNREFKVYYQPKVHVETGELTGAEALCRWIKDGKIVPPGSFIPALEQGVEICELDYYMLDCVCEDIARWLKEGRNVVRVSVNFSRKHLVETDMLEHILQVVDKHQVPHEYIEIELTETTTDVEFKDLKRVVMGLRSEGVYTAVDDFGMGYSSLNLIREIPWHVIKVDRSLLPETEADEESITGLMYKHVVNMIRELGMECVTEGVETKRQMELLRNNQCFVAQGFYFDKPLPMEEFENRLSHQFYKLFL